MYFFISLIPIARWELYTHLLYTFIGNFDYSAFHTHYLEGKNLEKSIQKLVFYAQ